MSSKSAISGLEPAILWQRFYEMSQVPRPSKKEEKITLYFENLFDSLGIAYDKDSVGNLVARVPATPGYEKAPIVVIQGHSDMVCEKNRGTEHDFDNDPIQLEQRDGWLRAKGTTLGADNGIGVATGLAVLTDKSLVHGPIELLITVDEETGLTGANGLATNLLKGKYLLNLDSEEDGILYVGCAGGMDTAGTFPIKYESVPAGYVAYQLMVSGLKGGHSGCEIHVGRGNAIKLLARAMRALKVKYQIAQLEGGSKRNAIPREASVVLLFEEKNLAKVQKMVAQSEKEFLGEYKVTDGGLKLTLEKAAMPPKAYAKPFAKKILATLLALPHGVIQMSADIEGLVETSTNLATIHTEGDHLIIGTNQRSSIESAKTYIGSSVASVLELSGAKINASDGYPGWKPNMESRLLEICKKAAVEVNGKAPEIKAIHAGLECGILGGKYPKMEMISFGPTITGAHSPDEQVNIADVGKFYDMFRVVLRLLASEKK